MSDEWPFADPPDCPVMASTRILDGGQPIRHVWHGEGYDQTWRFSERVTGAMDDGREVGLGVVAALHPTVGELAALPLDWTAQRLASGERWWWHRAYRGSTLERLVQMACVLFMVTIGLPLTLTYYVVYYGRIELRRRRIMPEMTRAIERHLPRGSRLWQAVAFLHSSDIARLCQSLKIERLYVDTFFKKDDAYDPGALWSQAYPDGKMLVAYAWTYTRRGAGQRVLLQFFFDNDDRLINHTLAWYVPK